MDANPQGCFGIAGYAIGRQGDDALSGLAWPHPDLGPAGAGLFLALVPALVDTLGGYERGLDPYG